METKSTPNRSQLLQIKLSHRLASNPSSLAISPLSFKFPQVFVFLAYKLNLGLLRVGEKSDTIDLIRINWLAVWVHHQGLDINVVEGDIS